MPSNLSLANCVLVVDDEMPAYVDLGVRETADCLREITGREIPVRTTPDPAAGVQIVVGEKRVRELAPELWAEKAGDLGTEGYFIHAAAGERPARLFVTGAGPQGTKYGLFALLRLIRTEGRAAWVPAATDMVSKPSFPVRGMHLNGWAFNYPYSFRPWREEDWKRYADLLAYQGANLFFIWPFMEIIPVPLSAADKAYLEEVRRVVDYAQRQRGLQVWIFQSANRVALNDCGVRDPRLRPYWVTRTQGDYPAPGQADMNPADPQAFAAIMQSREALYRIVDNADGYCTIDNDPGGWARSPLSEFMAIFKASRKLLDEITVHGPQTRQIYWLWYGWGQPGAWQPDWNEEKQLDWLGQTIRAMQREVPEPWWLIAGQKPYPAVCAAAGASAKTVYLPYNTIEGEPSRPGTQLDFPLIRRHLDEMDRFPETAGLMGNTQTALLQLPHVYYFLSAAWDFASRQRTPAELLPDLAELVYPEHRQLLADCWLALMPGGHTPAGELARQLEDVLAADHLGRPGLLGRTLFPDVRQLARDLILQLHLWAAFAALRQTVASSATPAACARGVEALLDAALTWDGAPGWSAYWHKLGTAWELLPTHDPEYPQITDGLCRNLGGSELTATALDAFLAPIGAALSKKHDPWIVAHCGLEPLKKAILPHSLKVSNFRTSS